MGSSKYIRKCRKVYMMAWYEIRMKFLHFLMEKVWKVPENTISPKPLRVIGYILFPTRWIMACNPWFVVDPARNAIRIKGVWVAVELLEALTRPSPYWFRVMRIENEMAVLERKFEEEIE